MGTDSFGRDIFSRIIHGSRITLIASFSSVGIAMIFGMVLGSIAGFQGGWLDNIIMRIMDVIMAFPTIVLMIVLMALVGSSLQNVIFVIAFIFIPQFARVTRSAIISEKVRPYVLAERALGASEFRVMFLHVLPNSLPPVIVVATMYIAVASLIEAAAGFLGTGVPPPTPTWGNMLKEGQAFIFSGEWWMSIFPGAAIFITVLAFNLLGDGLRDALDPTMRRYRR
jgi:ABC-type dipeptide/oligopeptide/nickel transport system permease subunit